jgi:enoyl-CoA hydratase/carnithine racemase
MAAIDPALGHLDVAQHGAVLVLTLDNPSLRNALGPQVYAQGREALNRAADDATIRAVVLTGANGVFCGGGNLVRLQGNRAKPMSVQKDSIDLLNGFVRHLRDCPKPVIAAVEGPAAGAGFSLVLACDFVVAANNARFVMSYAKVGLTPDGGGSYSLASALPRPLANELMMLGNEIDAARLQHFGLVNQATEPGAALDAAMALADKLAAGAGAAQARIKQLVNHAQAARLNDHLQLERDHFAAALHGPEAGEGIGAFLGKRKPDFVNAAKPAVVG